MKSMGRVLRRLSASILVGSCIWCQIASLAWAQGLEKAIPNCPGWVAAADDFLDECKERARYFTRTFYPSGGGRGEREQHSAWFASAPSNSHFVMGCTLGFDRSLRFLGLYYTAEPSAIAVANTAPIIGIDFDGNVVLAIDRKPVIFTAVRPFETTKVRTQWSGVKTALNCRNPLVEDGVSHLKGEDISADLSRRLAMTESSRSECIHRQGRRANFWNIFPRRFRGKSSTPGFPLCW